MEEERQKEKEEEQEDENEIFRKLFERLFESVSIDSTGQKEKKQVNKKQVIVKLRFH